MTTQLPTQQQPPPRQLGSLEELRETLGDDFVIFCGSAVSLLSREANTSFLPGVHDVSDVLFRQLANRLAPLEDEDSIGRRRTQRIRPGTSYIDRVCAAYANQLAFGKWSGLRKDTKFEELLWRLQKAIGEQNSDDKPLFRAFMTACFQCEAHEFNVNHAAIAYLSATKRIPVLTTNFDNAIEVAARWSEGRECVPQVHPIHPPSLSDVQCILKLHGDVALGRFVTTSPAQARAHYVKAYEYVTELLKGKRVLVAGYSGAGDFDISPHLKATSGGALVWIRRDKDPLALPEQATHWIISNLRAPDPAVLGERDQEAHNLLLGLAMSHGWDPKPSRPGPKWRQRVEKWVREDLSQEMARAAVRAAFNAEGIGWRAPWPVLHLHHVDEWTGKDRVRPSPKLAAELRWRWAKACIGVSAYLSAYRVLRDANSIPPEPQEASLFVEMKGFVEWRLGRLETALNTLKPLAFGDDVSDFVAGARRIYLESACDLLRSKRRLSDRIRLAHEYRLEAVSEILQDRDKPTYDSELLAQAAVQELQHLLKRRDEATIMTEVRKVLRQAESTDSWLAAERAARILVNLTPNRTSIRHLFDVNVRLIRQRHFGRMRKTMATLLHTLVPCGRPMFLELFDGWRGALLLGTLAEGLYRFGVVVAQLERPSAHMRIASAIRSGSHAALDHS